MKNPDLYPNLDQNSCQAKSALFVATQTSSMGLFMISAVNLTSPAIQGDIGVLIGIEPGTYLLLLIGNLLLLGFGFALFSSSSVSAIMDTVEKRHYGIASGTVAALPGQMTSMAAAVILSISTGLCVI